MRPAIRERLTMIARQVLPNTVRRRLKRLVRSYHRVFYPFTVKDLKEAVRHLGLGPGDVAMVHSSFDSFYGFQGGPADAVRALQEIVGTEGTLIMPTVPFRTTAVEYALGEPIFDVRRTVSRMGLISEVFRRSPGVVRSIHPTHSVAAWGNKADAIIEGHELAETPCGRLTPYGKLLEHDGKILFVGVPANTMTFGYFIAEELEPRLPVRVLTPEKYSLRCRDEHGTVRVSHVRLYTQTLDHDLSAVVAALKRRKQWRQGRAWGLDLILLQARDVYHTAMALADQGMFLAGRLRKRHQPSLRCNSHAEGMV